MAQDIIQFIWLQAAILLGVISSFVLPYVRKYLEGKVAKIDPTYVYHLIITALWQFILSFSVYSAWQPPEDIVSSVLIMILAFFFGFGGSTIQKEAEKWIKWLNNLSKKEEANTPTVDLIIDNEGTIRGKIVNPPLGVETTKTHKEFKTPDRNTDAVTESTSQLEKDIEEIKKKVE